MVSTAFGFSTINKCRYIDIFEEFDLNQISNLRFEDNTRYIDVIDGLQQSSCDSARLLLGKV